MKKKQFLKKLNNKLDILTKKERDKVLENLENKIDKEIKNGQKEKNVIKKLGNINDVVKDILKDYKISKEYIDKKSVSFEEKLKKGIDNFIIGIENFISNIDQNGTMSILKISVYFMIILFVFWFIGLPFQILREIGISLFKLFTDPMDNVLVFSWQLVVGVIHFVLIIWLVIYITKRINVGVFNDKRKEKYEEITEKKKTIDNKKENNNKNETISILLKTLIVILTLPLLCIIMCLFITIILIIGLLFDGFYLIGPLFIIMGLIFILSSIIDAIYHVIFGKGGSNG